jgi:hypothetical protein
MSERDITDALVATMRSMDVSESAIAKVTSMFWEAVDNVPINCQPFGRAADVRLP